MLILGRSTMGVEGSSESLRLSTRIVISTESTAVSIWRSLALYSGVSLHVLSRLSGGRPHVIRGRIGDRAACASAGGHNECLRHPGPTLNQPNRQRPGPVTWPASPPHGAGLYWWIRPPSRSRRTTSSSGAGPGWRAPGASSGGGSLAQNVRSRFESYCSKRDKLRPQARRQPLLTVVEPDAKASRP